MLEVRKYSGNVAPVDVCDQWLCRAHYALGQLVSEQSKTLKVRDGYYCDVEVMIFSLMCSSSLVHQGQPLINGTLESIKHVMKGLDIATSNARYLFLVYNGSVQHWHVAQPLQRAQMRKYLAPSMEKVMQALEKVPGQEEWKVGCDFSFHQRQVLA